VRGESPRARVTEVSEAGSVPFIQVTNGPTAAQGGQPAQPGTTEPRVNVAANVRGRGRVGLASALQ
jgi:hypothetical protein